MTARISNRPPLSVAFLLVGWILVTLFFWMFAFYHIPPATSEWLRRAQAVCFGIGETGLPDKSGWIMLTLAPLSLLGTMVVALGHEMKQGVVELSKAFTGKLLFVLLISVLIIEGVWITGRIREALKASENFATLPSALPDDYARLNRVAPSFSLYDQHGSRINLEKFSGRPVILTFAFAHCQTVCPLIINNSKEALKVSHAKEPILLIVTLDPWRDTPSSLPSRAVEWKLGEREYFLSGTPEEVRLVLDNYSVPRQRDEKTGDVVHPALVYVIDGAGLIAFSFNNPSVGWLADALKRVTAESEIG